MKKIISILTIITMFCLSPLVAKAADFGTSITGVNSIDAGGTTTLTFNVTGGTNIYVFQSKLTYDSSKLEIVSSSGLNGFNLTLGTDLVLDASNGKNGNFAVASFTFKGKSGFTAGSSTTIKLENVTASNGNADLSGTGSSITISVNVPKSTNNNLSDLKVNGTTVSGFASSKTSYTLPETTANSITIEATKEDSKATISGVGTKNLNYGNNKFTVSVRSESGITKSYVINIPKKDTRSTDNYLKSLSTNVGNIVFNKATQNYTLTVENNISSINISAVANDSKATVSGTGTKVLAIYVNKINVVVTAENKTKRTYTIIVNRKDEKGNAGELNKDNNLGSLTITGYTINFDPNTLEYNISVGSEVNSIEVLATPNSSSATLEIKNVDSLKMGLNKINVEVKSEYGDIKTYVINVTKTKDVPTTKLDGLEKLLSSSAEEVNVMLEGNEVLKKSLMEKIKKSKKMINFIYTNSNNKTIYYWKLDGSKIKDIMDLKLQVDFKIDNISKFNKSINYVDNIILNFAHNGNLPQGIEFYVNVDGKYSNKDKVSLYFYDNIKGNSKLIKKDVIIKDEFAKIDIDHCSVYFLTMASLNKTNIWLYISIVEIIVIIGLTVLLILKNKKVMK